MKNVDVIIVGAGAAGLMCAIEAGKRGRKVLILDHANKVGKKILMSGGGRCNFTNLDIQAEKYISHNPHFCKSALSRYTQWNFIDLVKKHSIPFHEKTLGQLFCDHKSQAIVDMLLEECAQAKVTIQLLARIDEIEKLKDNHFIIKTERGSYACSSLVIASGGLSIPTMGASPFAYKVAEQFSLKVWPTRAGLVPLTLHQCDKEILAPLAGISVEVVASTKRKSFRENLLFTHRGLSGPAILQLSSYWEPGEEIVLNFLPGINFLDELSFLKKTHCEKQLKTVLSELIPKRLVEAIIPPELNAKKIHSLSQIECQLLGNIIHQWKLKPNGTEGYRTAEVTLGGVDCDALSSKTMEVSSVKGLYFVGESVDVSGWLGGYNFQWAWSSGWAAGQCV